MNLQIVDYHKRYFNDCVEIFDKNTPRYFLLEEKEPFVEYLKATTWYFVVKADDAIVGCFGVEFIKEKKHARLHWIMVDPALQGQGIGSFMMEQVFTAMKSKGYQTMEVDTSQEGIRFFGKYQIEILDEIKNGWGLGMDRINLLLYI